MPNKGARGRTKMLRGSRWMEGGGRAQLCRLVNIYFEHSSRWAFLTALWPISPVPFLWRETLQHCSSRHSFLPSSPCSIVLYITRDILLSVHYCTTFRISTPIHSKFCKVYAERGHPHAFILRRQIAVTCVARSHARHSAYHISIAM